MTDLLFTAADLAEMRAFSEANLPDTVVLKSATVTRQSGGTYTAPNWATATVVATMPARVSSANAPQERLSAGSITEIRDFWVICAEGASVPTDTATLKYRLEWAHGIDGVTDPLPLYYRGSPLRSYRMESRFLCSTEGGQ